MNEKRLALLQRDELYVAGVFSSSGIFSTTLPTKSKSEVVRHVNGKGLKEENHPADMRVLEMVFEVMNGNRIDTSQLKFDFTGLTPKQTLVLKAVLKIPYGETRTYEDIAHQAGLQNASRFVGNVMASNRFPPLIPCHRVVAKHGIGGYSAGYGLATKRALLKEEGVFAD